MGKEVEQAPGDGNDMSCPSRIASRKKRMKLRTLGDVISRCSRAILNFDLNLTPAEQGHEVEDENSPETVFQNDVPVGNSVGKQATFPSHPMVSYKNKGKVPINGQVEKSFSGNSPTTSVPAEEAENGKALYLLPEMLAARPIIRENQSGQRGNGAPKQKDMEASEKATCEKIVEILAWMWYESHLSSGNEEKKSQKRKTEQHGQDGSSAETKTLGSTMCPGNHMPPFLPWQNSCRGEWRAGPSTIQNSEPQNVAVEFDVANRSTRCLELFPTGNMEDIIVVNAGMRRRPGVPINVDEMRSLSSKSIRHYHRQVEMGMFAHLHKAGPFAPKETVTRKGKQKTVSRSKVTRSLVGTSASLASDTPGELCCLNRNPAEFTLPVAGNRYMTGMAKKKKKAKQN